MNSTNKIEKRCKNPQCNKKLKWQMRDYCNNSHCEFQSSSKNWKALYKKLEKLKL